MELKLAGDTEPMLEKEGKRWNCLTLAWPPPKKSVGLIRPSPKDYYSPYNNIHVKMLMSFNNQNIPDHNYIKLLIKSFHFYHFYKSQAQSLHSTLFITVECSLHTVYLHLIDLWKYLVYDWPWDIKNKYSLGFNKKSRTNMIGKEKLIPGSKKAARVLRPSRISAKQIESKKLIIINYWSLLHENQLLINFLLRRASPKCSTIFKQKSNS